MRCSFLKGFLIFIALFAILSSCQTGKSPAYSTDAAAEAVEKVQTQQSAEKTGEYPPAVEVAGVIDFTSPEYRSLWKTLPREGKLIFFAATPRREFREKEILYCVKDAARQISLYHAAKVETKQAVKSNNRDLGYLESVDSGFDRDLAEKEIPKIKVLEHFRDAEGSYIIAEDEELSSKAAIEKLNQETESTSEAAGAPGWLTNIPDIKGMLVSVGVVQRSRYFADSLKKADDQALANLSRQISINVKSKRTDVEKQKGTAFSQTHYEVSSSLLKGFYVLGRWSEDHGNTFYTLAVCEQGVGD